MPEEAAGHGPEEAEGGPPPTWAPPGAGPAPDVSRQAWPDPPPPGYSFLPRPLPPGPGPGPVDVLGRPMASWRLRALAFAVDFLVLSVAVRVLVVVAVRGPFTVGSSTQPRLSPDAWKAVGLEILAWLAYFAFLEGMGRGQTLGKRFAGIGVRDARTGGTIGAGRALGRRFVFGTLFSLFFVPGIIDGLSPLWDPMRRSWHDHVAGSCVVDLR